MKTTVKGGKEVANERPAPREPRGKAPNVEAMHAQRIRWDGYFSGPTW
jgi:hypothetical protein